MKRTNQNKSKETKKAWRQDNRVEDNDSQSIGKQLICRPNGKPNAGSALSVKRELERGEHPRRVESRKAAQLYAVESWH